MKQNKIKKQVYLKLTLFFGTIILGFLGLVLLTYYKYVEPGLTAATVALVLGIAGIFRENIHRVFFGPDLKLEICLEPPDCHKVELKGPQGERIDDTYYFRFKIENSGNREARNVQVMMTKLELEKNGEYETAKNFLPLNLVWAHYKRDTMQAIPADGFKHCDFGHILRGRYKDKVLRRFGLSQSANIIFKTDVVVEPNTGSHIILPGNYRISVHLSSTNCKSIQVTVELSIKDIWDDDEKRMLRENISIKRV